MKILDFGSLNLDHVYSVDNFVRPGETISSLKMEDFCGGKGLNQSIALARAGAEVYHAGCIGKDGQVLADRLKEACCKELGEEPTMEYFIGGVVAINAGPNLIGLIYRAG